MKKRITLIAAALVLSCTTLMAQGLLGKIASGAAKADDAANTVNSAAGTVNKLGGLFGKKKKDKEAAANVTVVSVKGVDFATLKKLNEGIQACANVTETKMKFGADASTIEVSHKESTDELLKQMQETAKDILSEKSVEGLEEGKIALKLN